MGGRGRNARGVEGEGLLWVGRTGLEGGGTMQGAEGELEQAGEPLKAEVAAAEAEEPGEAKGLRCRTAEARVTRATARARAADGAARAGACAWESAPLEVFYAQWDPHGRRRPLQCC